MGMALMEPILQWLEELGFGQYGAAFVQADIEPAVLRDLSEADLQKLGVTLGHRKRLLRAIAEMPEPTRRPAALGAASPEGERRQLSVLFCDLVNSTALAARLDPEDLREVIGAYHRCCADVIARAGGFVGKYMGDGVLAYFGYPHAGEDDAERAVGAALELVDAVRHLNAGSILQARVGIATGLVVVGDLIGHGAAQEQAVVGETPNLAARLQALADPGMVVIGPRTRRLLGGLFEYRELGPVTLKGFAAPLPAFAVLRRGAVESRFEARQEGGVSPLVGRDEELQVLLARWRQAKAGEGQLVVLTGEPGIGKSRIVQALQDRLAEEPHIRLRYFCSPRHQDSALHPWIAQFAGAACFEREDEPLARLDKLDALFERTAAPAEDRALIAELLALPGAADRYGPIHLTPPQRKRNTLRALIRHLEGLALAQTVLMTFEDVHWIDPTSLELLDRIVEILPRVPALLLITNRPEFDASWAQDRHVSVLRLSRLDRRDCVALIGQIAGTALSGSMVEKIVDRTDGVPLFIEEITRAVLEAGAGTEPLGSAIPASLHASLTARFDRLGPAKEVAQIGAVIGRTFAYELLAAVSGRTDAELQTALERLSAAGLVFGQDKPPAATFLFKHALVQDAAYDTLLRSARRDWHGRIAAAIASRFPDIAETQPALLAHHYAKAGLMHDAISWWQRAADRAIAQSAHVEAANHLNIALALLGRQPATPERGQRELALRMRLTGPLVVTTGFASPQTDENYARAAELVEQIGAGIEALRVLWGQLAMVLVRSDLDKVDELAEKFIRLAANAKLRNGPCTGHRILGYAALVRGNISRSRRHFDSAMREFEQGSRFVFEDSPFDLYSMCLAQDVLVLQQEGFLDRATRQADKALAEARRINSPPSEGYVLVHLALAHMISGDVQRVSGYTDALRELIARSDLEYFCWHSEVLFGWLKGKAGALEDGIADIRHGLEPRQRMMANLWVPLYVLSRAELLLTHERPEEALPVFDECAALVAELHQHYVEPELHKLRAAALHAVGADPAAVEAEFDLALNAAQRQGARLYELRAATSRARIWKCAGRDHEAHALLAPIYAGFTEGFASADMRDAQALLAQLASGRSADGFVRQGPATVPG